MIEKLARTLYQTKFSYLDFIYHILTKGVQSKQIQIRCPIEKCKKKKKMNIDELRLHLVDECNKITMQCSLCRGQFRRPWKDIHDCR